MSIQLNEEKLKELITDYDINKLSLAACSRKYGQTASNIKEFLKSKNIHIRDRREQTHYTNMQRALSVDQTYFDTIDTPNKAWLVGFLAADGNVSEKRNEISIGLSSIDREILEKIKEELKIERKIQDQITNKGFAVSDLVWSSYNQKEKLKNLDVVPRKTYKETHIPQCIKKDKQLSYAYILGYFDGDGCLKITGNYCRFEICAYRPELLQDIADILNDLTNTDIKVYKCLNRELYTITWSMNATITILNTLYKSKGSLFLSRKYNKYHNWLKENNRI